MTIRIRDKGGSRQLSAWIAALKELPREMRAMPRDMAEEAVDLVKQTFENEADPYGAKWARLKYRSGRILQKTGGLKSSVNVATSGRGFTVSIARSYGAYHQTGTRRMPRRAMLPFRGMPLAWKSAFAEVAEERIGRKIASAGKGGSGGRIASRGSGATALAGKASGIINKAFESIE